MKRLKRNIALATALLITFATVNGLAQQSLDRTKVAAHGPNSTLKVPASTNTQLAKGAALIVAQRLGLPLLSFSITFLGGANQFEPAAKRGFAAMTASMLTEGTKTRTGDQLSDALQMLGTNINANVGSEDGSISLVSKIGRASG